MSTQTRAVSRMCSLILQAVGNLSPGGPIRIDYAKDLLKEALLLEGFAAGWRTDQPAELAPDGTFACPHCGASTPHQHVIDRKGRLHDKPDIVLRLRASMAGFDICLPGAAMAKEAADEIERLRARDKPSTGEAMSYAVKIEMQPHADEAKTITVCTRSASGAMQVMGFLHETSPVLHVSVPPGMVLELVDNAIGMPPALANKPPFRL